jgi:hypothetical protein
LTNQKIPIKYENSMNERLKKWLIGGGVIVLVCAGLGYYSKCGTVFPYMTEEKIKENIWEFGWIMSPKLCKKWHTTYSDIKDCLKEPERPCFFYIRMSYRMLPPLKEKPFNFDYEGSLDDLYDRLQEEYDVKFDEYYEKYLKYDDYESYLQIQYNEHEKFL